MPLKFSIRRVVVALGASWLLNYFWEVGQCPLFANAAPMRVHAVRCAVSAIGDVFLLLLTYAMTALARRQKNWVLADRPGVGMAICMALGLIFTVGIERWALQSGRWAYGPKMLAVFGIGLLPLLQWIVVPALLFVILRRRSGKWA
jgi:hypothetical protein